MCWPPQHEELYVSKGHSIRKVENHWPTVSLRRKSPLKDCLNQIGLWASLVGLTGLQIDMRGLSPCEQNHFYVVVAGL